jgi:hypothetical protein
MCWSTCCQLVETAWWETANRALRGCGCGFKKPQNRTPKPRWFNFWNIILSGAVAVLDVRLWFYRENRGCILNKGDCIIYKINCILYRGNCILFRGSCIIYRGGCKFTAVVACLKNLRIWWFNRNRGFGSCLAVLVRLRCYFFKMWLTAVYKKWHRAGLYCHQQQGRWFQATASRCCWKNMVEFPLTESPATLEIDFLSRKHNPIKYRRMLLI